MGHPPWRPTQRLDITYQTLYSELVQRSLDESFTSEFSANGRFVAVEVKGKKYWYFDTPKPEGGAQDRRYVGPVDDPEITKRVEAFKDLKADLKGRRRLVSTLTREAYLPRPLPMTGQVVEGLAKAGFFRMRGVLVGTVAYQCYPAVLGTRLDAVAMQTGDADFAQFHEISVAIKDSMPPILEVLRQVDPTFREIPSQVDGRVSTQFVSRDKFKVEFLTPNQWSDDQEGKPVADAGVGRGGGIPATLPRLSDLPAHPRGAAARCRRASPHPITGAIRHPQTHCRIPPEGGSRRDRKEFEGPASSQINHRSDDSEPAAC